MKTINKLISPYLFWPLLIGIPLTLEFGGGFNFDVFLPITFVFLTLGSYFFYRIKHRY